MITIEKDFATSEHNFISGKRCSPQHNVSIGLSKHQLEGESMWFTVWGDWGEIKNFQFDLEFKSKKEVISFMKDMMAVLKSELIEEK